MIILDSLSPITSLSKPCALAVGSFDGVHLGHQQILNRMRTLVGPKGTVAVLTFSNHPSHVLPGRVPVTLVLSKELKLKYLEYYGVDITFCLDFTLELADTTYNAFLQAIKKVYPFDYLIFGQGDGLGKKREGTPDKVERLGEDLGFMVEYIPKLSQELMLVSSGSIRSYIQKGEIVKAESLLGHPLELEGTLELGQLKLPANLCLPPNGDYPVTAEWDSSQKKISAHLQDGKVFVDLPMQGKKISLSFQ